MGLQLQLRHDIKRRPEAIACFGRLRCSRNAGDSLTIPVTLDTGSPVTFVTAADLAHFSNPIRITSQHAPEKLRGIGGGELHVQAALMSLELQDDVAGQVTLTDIKVYFPIVSVAPGVPAAQRHLFLGLDALTQLRTVVRLDFVTPVLTLELA